MNLSRTEIHEKLHLFLSLCIAFFLPIARLVPIFIILLFLNWIIEGNFRRKFQSIYKRKFSILFVGFYLLHLFGLLYTQNLDSGLFDVQVKLSLFIFPLLFASKPFGVNDKQKIFVVFVLGCVTSLLILLSRAIFLYLTKGENHFYYESFSAYLIHPSYLSMYLCLVISWLLINVLNKNISDIKFPLLLSIVLLIFFSGFVFVLSSKTGIIALVLIFFAFLIYSVIITKRYLLGAVGIIATIFAIVLTVRFVPEISDRMNRMICVVKNGTPEANAMESTGVRMLVWSASNEVISENLILGTGTGDSKDELMKVYEERRMTGAYEHNLNAHNEYYQVFVSLGIIGFILLCANLWFPFFSSIKSGNTIYVLFLLIIIINFLTESMFETQAGVMFYGFFNSLLCFRKSKTEY